MTDRECDDLVLYILRASAGHALSIPQIMEIVRALGYGSWNPMESLHRLGNVIPGDRIPPKPDFPNPLTFVYTNHRGETAIRTVAPIRIYHGATEFHQEPQWLLEAIDLDKDSLRTFAMRDMKEIK